MVFVPAIMGAGLVFSVAIVSFTVAVIVAPRLPPRFTGLRGCVMFAMLGALCLLLAMTAATYPLFLLAFSVGFGIASGAIYINALSVVTVEANKSRGQVNWISGRRHYMETS